MTITRINQNTVTRVKGNSESSYRTGDVNLTAANIGAAASSHGNHVPATQTANNKRFLRCDNTGQDVTPGNIGAAASSHSHNTTTVTSIGTLSSPTSINQLGYYMFGDIGGALLTKWNNAGIEKPGDYHAVCLDFNGNNSGCIYGTLIVTSPRSQRIFLVGIWNSGWNYVRQI